MESYGSVGNAINKGRILKLLVKKDVQGRNLLMNKWEKTFDYIVNLFNSFLRAGKNKQGIFIYDSSPTTKELNNNYDDLYRSFVEPPTKSTRDIEAADPKLQMAFKCIKRKYEKVFPGYTLIVTSVYRTIKEQQRLYTKGRTKPGKKVTWVDGIKKKGNHNYYPSKAIDVAVKKIGGRITWDKKRYLILVDLARQASNFMNVKIRSGGSWKRFKDYPHLEV